MADNEEVRFYDFLNGFGLVQHPDLKIQERLVQAWREIMHYSEEKDRMKHGLNQGYNSLIALEACLWQFPHVKKRQRKK